MHVCRSRAEHARCQSGLFVTDESPADASLGLRPLASEFRKEDMEKLRRDPLAYYGSAKAKLAALGLSPERNAALTVRLQSLPVFERACIVLCTRDRMSYAQIAQRLGSSVEAVQAAIARAVAAVLAEDATSRVVGER